MTKLLTRTMMLTKVFRHGLVFENVFILSILAAAMEHDSLGKYCRVRLWVGQTDSHISCTREHVEQWKRCNVERK